jgi:hypothetical protein
MTRGHARLSMLLGKSSLGWAGLSHRSTTTNSVYITETVRQCISNVRSIEASDSPSSGVKPRGETQAPQAKNYLTQWCSSTKASISIPLFRSPCLSSIAYSHEVWEVGKRLASEDESAHESRPNWSESTHLSISQHLSLSVYASS